MRPKTPIPHREKWLAAFAAGILLIALLIAFQPASAADGVRSSVLGKVVPLPDSQAEIQSPATARILSPKERPYMVGDVVKKGDPVAIIEHRYNLHDASHLSTTRWELLRDMLDARAKAVEAKVNREKAERLLALGSVSGQEVANLKGEEAVAQSEYLKRKALLGELDTEMQGADLVRRGVFSPIDGEITFVNFTQGQVINEGVLLFRIVSRKQVGFSARFPETEFQRWASKATVKIRFDSLPGKVYVGHTETISPTVDPQTRTRDVLFRVDNPGEYLRFGMLGTMEFE